MAEQIQPNTLQALRADLAKEWHPTRNGRLSPRDVRPDSFRRVWWRCQEGHWWKASVRSRTEGKKCIFCEGVLKKSDQCLGNLRPDLLKEWHPTRNQGLKFDNVLCNHPGKVWWICRSGHEWEASVLSRLSGSGCPSCKNVLPRISTGKSLKEIPESENQGRPDRESKGDRFDELPSFLLQSTDLRKSKRYKHSEVVLVERPWSGILGYAEIQNFSAGGMLLGCNFSLSRGETILVRFNKPLYQSTSNPVFSKVVWCRDFKDDDEIPSRFGIGVSLA